jgi:hypothetical protein
MSDRKRSILIGVITATICGVMVFAALSQGWH